MPQPVLNISEEEAIAYSGLPKEVILKRYIRAHKDETCPHCNRFVGNHTEKQLAKCADTDGLVVKINELEQMEPIDVAMVLCASCRQYAPPAPQCIWCGRDFEPHDFQ